MGRAHYILALIILKSGGLAVFKISFIMGLVVPPSECH